MSITLTPEPQTSAPGSIVTVHVVVAPAATKRIKLRSGSLAVTPPVVTTDATAGTGKATVTIPANRKTDVTVKAFEVDDKTKPVPGGDSGQTLITVATAPAPNPAPAAGGGHVDPFSDDEIEDLRSKFEQAQAEAAKQTAILKEREKASALLSASSTTYSKASAEIQNAMGTLNGKKVQLKDGSLLKKETCDKIQVLRQTEESKITTLQSRIKDLNKRIDGAKDAASKAQLALTEAQSAYDRVSKGLEKELTTHMKALSDLEREIAEGEKSGDTLRVYFLALELEDELSKVKTSPASPLDTRFVYALQEPDFKSQFSGTWLALQQAMRDQGDANDELNSLRKQFEKAKSDLADAQSQRKQNIVKEIKKIAAS